MVTSVSEHYSKRFTDLFHVLGEEFDRHVIEDPDFFSACIPPKAHTIVQLEVPESVNLRLRREVSLFNQWARDLVLKQSEPVVAVFKVDSHVLGRLGGYQ